MTALAPIPAIDEDRDFVAAAGIDELLTRPRPFDPKRVRDIVAKSLSKEALSVEETSMLLAADEPELVEEIFAAARSLKETVYGNRVVLFAPLYVGNACVNDCRYCSFRKSNPEAHRRTLRPEEIDEQVGAMVDRGHKRLILVFGEHPAYDADFIAETARRVYAVRRGHGEIRRINVNAAPLDVAGYEKVAAAGIGTYQIFQETYHRPTYAAMHPGGTRKSDYMWRLTGLHRAMEAGCDDVGIGALFGLADWRYDLLALVAHALDLQRVYGVGCHTVSFPRLRPACGVDLGDRPFVSDADFKRIVAVLRLAIPYTGMILTAREPAALRRELMAFGVSQIDAGSHIEIGGYTEVADGQIMEREQFQLGDMRSLDQVMAELMGDGYLPSFCTACYRLGRTGEHFMEFAIPGFIKRYCTPNALTTLLEYLVDYASPETRAVGERLVAAELAAMSDGPQKTELLNRLDRIRSSEDRDLYF